MNISGIEAFLSIIEFGNLTRAAENLFISQSTLSTRLSNLEKDIGFRLFDRKKGTKNLSLTAAGKEFIFIAQNYRNFVLEIEKLKNLSKNKTTISIGSVDTLNAFIFPPLYSLLRKHNPPITLNVRTYNSDELYQRIQKGQLDVAFTLLNIPTSNISIKEVYKEPRVILLKGKLNKKSTAKLSPKDLDPKKEILFIGDISFHNWYRKWKGNSDYPLLQVDTVQLLVNFMQEKDSWSIVPFCIARKLSETSDYNFYHPSVSPPERICYRIQSANPPKSILESLKIFDVYLNKLQKQIF